jgi:glycosyltransferase involved in cell wall biosynthesis
MKKVLIIAHLYHASPRIPGLAKYLPEFGWQPIILTTPLGESPDAQFGPPNDFKKNNKVIETHGYVSPYGKKKLASKKYNWIRPLLKSIYKYYKEIAQYPDAEKDWKTCAVKTGSRFLQNGNADAMISSSSPVISHIIAKELKEKFGIPWVADLRDLWTQNHNYPYSGLRRMFERRLELKILSKANALVTVSKPWAEELSMLHKREVYAITNGFDPEKMSSENTDLTSKFTITYTGQIYGKQDPSKLLAAFKDLISNGEIDPNDVEVRFYGPEDDSLAENIAEYGLSKIVRQYGTVSREIAFERQRESQLLLLLKWEDRKQRGWHSGKIFEYLAARRPIIATGGAEDVITEVLNETEAGVDAYTVESIKNVLRKSFAEYKQEGRTSYQGKTEKIDLYSYREMAKKFAGVLNKVA